MSKKVIIEADHKQTLLLNLITIRETGMYMLINFLFDQLSVKAIKNKIK